jgi:hypothetical protein
VFQNFGPLRRRLHRRSVDAAIPRAVPKSNSHGGGTAETRNSHPALNTEEDSNQNAATPKTMKTRRKRDRLNRMEAMLHEVVILQVRLSKHTVAEIDDVIAMVPQFRGFSRGKFIRASVQYALYQIEETLRTADATRSDRP